MSVTKEASLHSALALPTGWTPHTEKDRVEVRKQLNRILASPPFGTSKRYPALLQYVVEEALDGNSDKIKERCLGIEVFHRDPAYDTNSDPVVRFAAGEVRKRLAQYYYDPKHSQELHIELPHGSYVPEFRFPKADETETASLRLSPSDHAIASEPEGDVARTFSEPIAPQTKRNWGKYRALLLPMVVGLALGAATVHLHPWVRPTASDKFWGPFLGSVNPVLICVGEQFAGQIEMKPNVARIGFGQVSDNQASLNPNVGAARFVVPSNVNANPVLPREVPVFARSNAVTLTSAVAVLQSKNKAYSIRGESDTTFSDLRSSPAILIGAFDNDWTIRLTDQLRFHFEQNLDMRQHWIADRQKPDEKIGLGESGRAAAAAEDYAIVSRVYDPATEQMMITLAGLGGHGTLAAGEFIGNPSYMEEFAKQAPRNWDRGNVQLVIRVDIVDGKNGPPHVIASYFW